MHDRSLHIRIEKGVHRGEQILWLLFFRRWDWLSRIKTLKEIRYSGTHSRWYLPQDKTAWHHFTELGIPWQISGTREEGKTERPSHGEPAPQYDDTGISSAKERRAIARPSTGLEGDDIQDEPMVSWTSNGFVLNIPYSHDNVVRAKSLQSSWWNERYKCWLCKGSLYNLEKIQEYWHPFSNEIYQQWFDKISLIECPCTLELYYSPKFPNYVCAALAGYGANHQPLKQVSGRRYHKELKIYLIPHDKKGIEEVLARYRSMGYGIMNRLEGYQEARMQPRSKASQVEYYVRSLPIAFQGDLRTFGQALLRQNYGKSTVKQYLSKAAAILRHYQKTTLDALTAREVNAYLDAIAAKGVSYSSLNQVHSAVRAYHKLVSMDHSFELDALQRPKKPKKLPRFLSAGETQRLIDAVENVKHLAILFTIYGSGLRRGELLNIELSHVYWDRNQVLIVNGKGAKDRMVNLSIESKKVLDLYVHQYKPVKYLFESQEAGKPYSATSVSKIVSGAAQKAGISKRVTPHMLRHSFATHLMDRGIAVPKIQALLGHKDIKTTMIYTHLTTQDITQVGSPLDALMKNKKSP